MSLLDAAKTIIVYAQKKKAPIDATNRFKMFFAFSHLFFVLQSLLQIEHPKTGHNDEMRA